ncbi:MAG: UDP-N-acetylmuramate dehydrogenase [Peptoniphilaceae bacterium]
MLEFQKFGKLKIDEELKEYTSFKIGGKVKALLFPENEERLVGAIKLAREQGMKYLVLGNCTNILADDSGFDGLIILLQGVLDKIKVKDSFIEAQCGASLRSIGNKALEYGLSGFEFAHGIPGSLGGGVIMNAGAYDGELKDIIYSVRLLDNEGDIKEYSNTDMKFSYRDSIAQQKGYIILSAIFKLHKKDKFLIKEKMDDLWNRRISKQPLDLPSAGSTFRRPKGYFAGKLIDDSGLRGFRHGGAMISQKHCGFVVNVEEASSKDVKELIETVQKVVYDKFGVKLQREVKFVGGSYGNSDNNRHEWSR